MFSTVMIEFFRLGELDFLNCENWISLIVTIGSLNMLEIYIPICEKKIWHAGLIFPNQNSALLKDAKLSCVFLCACVDFP